MQIEIQATRLRHSLASTKETYVECDHRQIGCFAGIGKVEMRGVAVKDGLDEDYPPRKRKKRALPSI